MAASLTEQLADRIAAPVDAAIRARARLHLLDWLGCVAGARRSPLAAKLRGMPALEAAALLGNVLEMDDVHRAALLHPGPVVWPAALMAAQACGATFAEVLDAGVRGYEAAIAVGVTFDARHYGFHHNTATAGVFGSTAASWSVWGDDTGVLVCALGHAGSISAGLWAMRHETCDTKQFHILHAVESGERARRLAAAGLAGPRHILEGPQGLYATTCDAPQPARLLEAADWRMAEVSFKPWAACRHAHAAIDAALGLYGSGALQHGPIIVKTYRDALTFCNRPAPRTPAEARFSIQHAVAVVAVRGAPTPADFEADALADPALVLARARVVLVEDRAASSRYPGHFGAAVKAGGAHVALVDTRGDPERPLGAAGVEAKARTLAAWGGIDPDELVALAMTTPDDTEIACFKVLATWLET